MRKALQVGCPYLYVKELKGVGDGIGAFAARRNNNVQPRLKDVVGEI